jgi:hypothetical protein
VIYETQLRDTYTDEILPEVWVGVSFKLLLGKAQMDDSQTNPPPATPAAPASSPIAENSGKPPENTSPINRATASALSGRTVGIDQSTIRNIFLWISEVIVAQTHLPEGAAELIAFWIISTWLQEALTVFPLLVITGPAHDATVVLRLLNDLCRAAGLMADFKRADLKDLNFNFHTVLISAPDLDNRTTTLLGNLTNPGFMIVDQRSYLRCSASRAIYLGEDAAIKKIQHAIHINIATTNGAPPSPPEWLPGYTRALPQYLEHYRKKNVDQVRQSTFNPSGVTSERAAMAKALGSCIVDAPELQQKLVTLLTTQDQQDCSQRSGTIDAVVIEAVLALCREGRARAFTSEIAGEANRLVELRGERSKLKPETVGRRLRQLGLRTHRLSLAGNGLTFDKPSVDLIERLGTMYVEEDLRVGTENLHCQQPAENKVVEEVM